MNTPSGSPTGFVASVYSSAGGIPGSSLGCLSGSDPLSGGIFTYTNSGIMLSPSTVYLIVLTAATPAAQGAYSWNYDDNFSYDTGDYWRAGAYAYSSSNGSSWFRYSYPFQQLAIYATAAPEPSTLALAGLGLAALSFWRRKS